MSPRRFLQQKVNCFKVFVLLVQQLIQFLLIKLHVLILLKTVKLIIQMLLFAMYVMILLNLMLLKQHVLLVE